jgi:hypothetical protein
VPEPIIKNDLRRLRALHALLGSSNEGERENARRKIDSWLGRHDKNWNDLAGLLHDPDANTASASADPREAKADQQAASDIEISAVAMLLAMLEQYISLQPHEYLAVALWIAHTFVFDRFMVTPRLASIGPVHNCGKTTLLDIISCLGARAEKSDNITAAAIYHAVSEECRTLLIDEFDNLDVVAKGALRAVLNSGHRKGGSVTRMVGGRVRRFATFAPMAMASIGALPLAQMSRSIVIKMVRYNGVQPLRRFDRNDTAVMRELDFTYVSVKAWMQNAKLNLDPELPSELRGWRPLIAIADACGPVWGAEARAAALKFAQDHLDEDIAIVLLMHIRDIFDARGLDRQFSKSLVEALNAIEDGPWWEWRGVDGKGQPRRLSQDQLAAILKRFDIRPRSVWSGGKSGKGYYRSQFEPAWAAYLHEGGRPAEPRNIRLLRNDVTDT